jgi:hypothetical protein
MSQPPSDVPPLILPPPLPAAKEDDYADPGIRAIDLSERPVAESLREIMASSPRVPREVPPPLPPVTSVRQNRHWTLALLGLVYLFSAFFIAGEGVWCLVSHDADAAPMDRVESVRLWLENPVWVVWGLTLGLGLILARRWARRLVMAEAISFLVSSLVVALAFAADAWPNFMTYASADDGTPVWYYWVALSGVVVLAVDNALDGALTLVFTAQDEGLACDLHYGPGMSAAEGFRLGGDPAQGTPFVA